MEHCYNIRSKLYVKPPKRKMAFRLALSIALVMVLLSGIVTMLMEGFSIGTLGYMAIAFVIVTNYNRRPSSNPHYESAYAEVKIDSRSISVNYKQLGERYDNLSWVAEYVDITKLEYSDQLECLHILGSIKIVDTNSLEVKERTDEHLLYIEKGREKEILEDLSRTSGLNIVFVDR